ASTARFAGWPLGPATAELPGEPRSQPLNSPNRVGPGGPWYDCRTVAVKTSPQGAPRPTPKHGKRQAPKGEKRGFFRRFWWVFVVTPLVLILAVLGVLVYAYEHIQIPNAPPPAQTTYVYDRHGHLITTLHAQVNRTNI